MLGLGSVDREFRTDPVAREIVIGIGIAWSSFLGSRRFAGVGVAVPGNPCDLVEFRLRCIECRIGVGRQEALAEFRLVELGRWHPLPGLRSVCHARPTPGALTLSLYRSISSRVGSSIASLTRTRKVTASRPSIRR